MDEDDDMGLNAKKKQKKLPLNASMNTKGSFKSTGIKEGAYLKVPNFISNFVMCSFNSKTLGCIFIIA